MSGRLFRLTLQAGSQLAVAVGTLFGVSLAVFFGMHALPGDAAQVLLGRFVSPDSVHIMAVKLGLNRSLLNQYGTWLWNVLHGNFGQSWASGTSVWSTVGGAIGNTAVLAFATIILLVPISAILGVLSAIYKGRLFDNAISSLTLSLIALPEFVVGAFLVAALAVGLHLLPAVSLLNAQESPLLQPRLLVLPVITLLAGATAGMVRMLRACLINVLSSDYVEMARLKGAPERRVIFRHALPNALGPSIQVLALSTAWLAGGVVVTEAVFQYPGLGSELTQAVAARDIPTVEACVMVITATYVAVNLVANLAVTFLNPRLRRGQ